MLRVSLKGLWAHKRRLFGSVFAVLLGVAFLAGTLVLGASGTLNGRLGASTAFAITLTVGITILFAGFLVATSTPSVRARATPPDSAQHAPQDLASPALG